MRKTSTLCAVLLLQLFVINSSAVRAQEHGCTDYTRVFPHLANTESIPGGAHEVQIVGDLAYVAQDEGLSIWDVTDPRNPGFVSSLATGLGAQRLLAVGQWAVADDGQFRWRQELQLAVDRPSGA